jgi:acyl-CoA thioester hydrolase
MAPFINRIRVRYGESDQMGIAHHAAYIGWLEEARIEMMRDIGILYRDLEERGIFMPVVDLSIRYRKSLRFDDIAECSTTVELAGPSRLVFRTVIGNGGQVCAEGSVTVATLDDKGRPIRLPGDVAARFKA